MLEQLSEVLQKKYPRLHINHKNANQERIYIYAGGWIMSIYINQVRFRNSSDHFDCQDISPADPNYFQTIDELLNRCSTN